MDLTDDPDAFLLTLERVATGAGWGKETWAPHLCGEAQASCMALSKEQALDYDVMKAAILDWVELSAPLPPEKPNRQKNPAEIMDCLLDEGVQPRAYVIKVTNSAICWLRPDIRTVGKSIDLIVLEQFLQGFPENTKAWVGSTSPTTLKTMIKLSGFFLEANFPRREA